MFKTVLLYSGSLLSYFLILAIIISQIVLYLFNMSSSLIKKYIHLVFPSWSFTYALVMEALYAMAWLYNHQTRGQNFSLAAHYSLKFSCYLLLIGKSLVTRCKICLLLVAEVAYCKKSLVTCCKIHSLLAAEVAHCKN